MFPCDNEKPRELAKYSLPLLTKHSVIWAWTSLGTGLGDHVHPRKGNFSARAGHAESITDTDTGTRLESDRAPHRTGDHGDHDCVDRAELSDLVRKGPGAQRHRSDFGSYSIERAVRSRFDVRMPRASCTSISMRTREWSWRSQPLDLNFCFIPAVGRRPLQPFA